MRDLKKIRKYCQGSISIFLVLVMLPMFVCAGLIVDGARLSAAKTLLSGAGDLSMNAALSEFDKTLQDLYGLFAISQSEEELSRNVQRYFANTIESATGMQATDSYTEAFLNSIGSWIDTQAGDGTQKFDNLIDARVLAYPVNNHLVYYPKGSKPGDPGPAVLENPEVLEGQIIEFMKYRGPIELGQGLLTKLGLFSNAKQQTAAVEKKVEYDKKLEGLQGALQAWYDAINNYNAGFKTFDDWGHYPGAGHLHWGSGYEESYWGKDYLHRLNACFATQRANYAQLTDFLLAFNSVEDSAMPKKSDSQTETNFKSTNSSLTKVDQLNQLASNLDSTIRSGTAFYTAYYQLVSSYGDGAVLKSEAYGDLTKQEEFIRQVQSFTAAHKTTCTYLTMLDGIATSAIQEYRNYDVPNSASQTGDWNNKKREIDNTERNKYMVDPNYNEELTLEQHENNKKAKVRNAIITESNDRIDKINDITGKYQQYIDNIAKFVEECPPIKARWKVSAKYSIQCAAEILSLLRKDAVATSKLLETALQKATTVKTEVTVAQNARNAWGNSIKEISEGEIRTGMEGDYTSSAAELDIQAVECLETLLTEAKTFFDAIVTRVDGTKFFTRTLYDRNADNDSDMNYFINQLKGKPRDTAGDVMQLHYVDGTVQPGLTNANCRMIIGNTDIKTTETEKERFYSYLVKVCKKIEVSMGDDTTDYKKERKDKFDEGKKGADDVKKTDIPGMPTDTLPTSDLIKSLMEPYGISPEDLAAYNPTDASDADSLKNNTGLSAFSDFFGNIGSFLKNLALDGRDALYVEEYITGMFSCLTTDTVEGTHTAGSEKTLTRNKMDGNNYYRAEQEYIIFGKKTAGESVAAAKAWIFGLRYALNTIYAFTATEIREPALAAATAIAGWTGFGVPIVQTIIILAWSLAETAVDLGMLCNGDSVVVYKSKDSWMLGLGGAKQIATDLVKQTAAKLVDTALNKVVDAVENGIGSVNDTVNDYVKGFTDNAKQAAIDAVVAPLQELTRNIVGTAASPDNIKAKVDETLQSIETSIKGDSVSAAMQKEVVKFAKGQSQTIANKITELYNKGENLVVTEITKSISSIFDNVGDSLTGLVDGAANELKSKVGDIAAEGGAAAKEKIMDAVDNFSGKISGVSPSSGNNGDTSSVAGRFTLTYKEYLKIFLLMGMLTEQGKKTVVTRAGVVIEKNVQKYANDPSFSMRTAQTVVEARADIIVRTTFLNITPKRGSSEDIGIMANDLDYGKINQNAWGWKLSYYSINGY